MLLELMKAVKHYTERQLGSSPFTTPIAGLTVLRSDCRKFPNHLLFKPSLCMTVSGKKSAVFGKQRLEYGPGQALVVSVETPGFGTVIEASLKEPFLGLILELDPAVLREVLSKLEVVPQADGRIERGIFVEDTHLPLQECLLRLVCLIDSPAAIPVLYPAIMQEICYWLLIGPNASGVLRMTLAQGQSHGVIQAIHALRSRFREPVRIEMLANIAKLSTSAFHRHFKAITSMTPLQYQKQLRLMEARRLMVSEAMNVESAAFQVGYESPSQFSREYSRLFAKPPRRDIEALRLAAA